MNELAQTIEAVRRALPGEAGNQALRTLPRYILLGPPGAGKTAVLRASGQNFRYTAPGGDGATPVPTQGCEMWVTPDALILDTSGAKYFSDANGQIEFARLLSDLTPTLRIGMYHGVICVVPVDEFARGDAQAVSNTARVLRDRLTEITRRQGTSIPVYVLLTKADHLPGFADFVQDFHESEKQQVWGFTAPIRELPVRLADTYKPLIKELVEVVGQRAYKEMHATRNIQARERIHQFVQYVDFMSPLIGDFLRGLFGESPTAKSPLLRGLYLCSSTQDAPPGGFQYGRKPESYFVHDLFKRVAVPDADFVGPIDQSNQMVAVRYAGASLGTLIALGTMIFTVRAYGHHKDIVSHTRDVIDAAATMPSPEPPALIAGDSFEPLRVRVGELEQLIAAGPFAMSLGFDYTPQMLDAARDAYAFTVKRALVSRLLQQDHGTLTQFAVVNEAQGGIPSADERHSVSHVLKFHLLLSGPRGLTEPPPGRPEMHAWLNQEILSRWSAQQHITQDSPKLTAMQQAVGYYLTRLDTDQRLQVERDQTLVGRVRQIFARTPNAAAIVAQIVADERLRTFDATTDTILGHSLPTLHSAGRVRGVFTRQGFEARVRNRLYPPAADPGGEPWVLGFDFNEYRARNETVLAQARSMYFDQYQGEWTGFLRGLTVATSPSADRSLEIIREISAGEPPPYSELMQVVAYNARLEIPADAPAVDPTSDAKTPRTLDRAMIGFYRFGVPSSEAGNPGLGAGGQAEALASNTPLAGYYGSLAVARDAIAAQIANPGRPAKTLAPADGALAAISGLIDRQESNWRPVFRALLYQPAVAAVNEARAVQPRPVSHGNNEPGPGPGAGTVRGYTPSVVAPPPHH